VRTVHERARSDARSRRDPQRRRRRGLHLQGDDALDPTSRRSALAPQGRARDGAHQDHHRALVAARTRRNPGRAMSVTFDRPNALGTHRVIEPAGAMPQSAWKIDITPVACENEILCEVETLNIDSASFKQIADAEGGDAAKIATHVERIIRERGKQHNPVTGSGGMFIGRVLEVGRALRGVVVAPGDRIASLVSLTLTPLHLESIERVDVSTGRIWVKAKAILFESGLWAKLPADIDENV